MPLVPSNNPDIALAEEWIAELEIWLDAHGTVGPDPFDIKAHPRIRALQEHPFLRRASTVLCDMAPHLARRLLRIPPTENPKTHALLALGRLRLFQLTGDTAYRDKARGHLQWLLDNACDGYSGLCWGYPFAIAAQGLHLPPHSPVCVVGAIAGEAFLLAHEVLGDPAYRDAAHSIATHFLRDVPVVDFSTDMVCFSYGVDDRRLVHNVNVLVAQHLLEVAVLTDDEPMAQQALRAVQFTLNHQRSDGAFPYGYYLESEPFEAALLHLVDHHHSGFVLRALSAINLHAENPVLTSALRRGYAFYRRTLLRNDGMPLNEGAPYPVNIHGCAEAILCPVTLSREILGAKAQAMLALRWSWSALRDPSTGAPYYRKYKRFTSKISYPRWGVAWMYRALAEYLWQCGGK